MDLGRWYPQQAAFFWTAKILLCRAPACVDAAVFQRIAASLDRSFRELGAETSVCTPDARISLFDNNAPHINDSLAAVYWVALLVADARLELDALAKFQMDVMTLYGIEKCLLLVVGAGHASPELQKVAADKNIKYMLCPPLMDEVPLYADHLNAQVKKLLTSVGEDEPPPVAADACPGGWRTLALEVRTCVNKLIISRLESDEQDLMSAAKTDIITHRKRAEARLKKLRAECYLLLKDPGAALASASQALDLQKTTSSLDQSITAQCHEIIAFSLSLYKAESEAGGRADSDSDVSEPPIPTPPEGDGFISVVESYVRDALSLKKGAGGGGGGGLLQMLGPGPETDSSAGAKSSSRRGSVATNASVADIGAAIAAKLKEAANIYIKISPLAAAICFSLCASSLGDDRLAALECLTNALELAQKTDSNVNAVAGAHVSLAISHKFLELQAPRKAIFAAFLATLRFSEFGCHANHPAYVACGRAILETTCALASRLDITPLISQSTTACVPTYSGDLIHSIATYMQRSYTSSLIPIELKSAYQLNALRDSRNVYGWPGVQALLSDRMKRIAEYLNDSMSCLWLAMIGFSAVAAAFDARTQTISQRTLAAREASLAVDERLTMVVDKLSARIMGIRSAPWIIPPSVTLVSTAAGADALTPAMKALLQCYPGSTGVSTRRLQRREAQVSLRYVHFGGFLRGHYVPQILSIEPRTSRRVALPMFKSRLVPGQRTVDVLHDAGASSTFLFKPWTKTSKAVPQFTAWAVGDLYSVCVRVKNTLGTDIMLDGCKIESAGAKAQCQPITVGLPPASYDMLFDCLVIPTETGIIHFLGLSYFFSRVPVSQYLFKDTEQMADLLFHGTAETEGDLLLDSSVASVQVVPELPRLVPRILLQGEEELLQSGSALKMYEGEVVELQVVLENSSHINVDALKFVVTKETTSDVDKIELREVGDLYFLSDFEDSFLVWPTAGNTQSVTLSARGGFLDGKSDVELDAVPARGSTAFTLRVLGSPDIENMGIHVIYKTKEHTTHWRYDSVLLRVDCRRSLRISLHPFFNSNQEALDDMLITLEVVHPDNADDSFSLIVRRDAAVILLYRIPREGQLTKVPLRVPRRWIKGPPSEVLKILWRKIVTEYSFEWESGIKRGKAILAECVEDITGLLRTESLAKQPLRSASAFRRMLTEVPPMPDAYSAFIEVRAVPDGEPVVLNPDATTEVTLAGREKLSLRLVVRKRECAETSCDVISSTVHVTNGTVDGSCGFDFVFCGSKEIRRRRFIETGEEGVCVHSGIICLLQPTPHTCVLHMGFDCELSNGMHITSSPLVVHAS